MPSRRSKFFRINEVPIVKGPESFDSVGIVRIRIVTITGRSKGVPRDAIGHMRDGGAVVEFSCTEILCSPNLTADFDGMAYISVCVSYRISRTKRKQKQQHAACQQ